MYDTLVPIFICVVLPVSIVLITAIKKILVARTQSDVLIKAIEANPGIEPDSLAEALKKPKKTAREILNTRLLIGCICTLVGVVLLVIAALVPVLTVCTDSESWMTPLVFGGIALAIGISYLIVYFVTRRQVVASEETE